MEFRRIGPRAFIPRMSNGLSRSNLPSSSGAMARRSTPIIPATDTTFWHHAFKVSFDGTGKKWVRFAVWDSAGNGAWVQPTNLN